MIDPNLPAPTGWTSHEVVVWVVGLVSTLLGGGAVTNIWLKRYDRAEKNDQREIDQERALTERASKIIAEQDRKIDEQENEIRLLLEERMAAKRAEMLAEVKNEDLRARTEWIKTQSEEIRQRFIAVTEEMVKLRTVVDECERDKMGLRSDVHDLNQTVRSQTAQIERMAKVIRELSARLAFDPEQFLG